MNLYSAEFTEKGTGEKCRVFTEAEDKQDAIYEFHHSVYTDKHTGKPIRGKIDYRTVRLERKD